MATIYPDKENTDFHESKGEEIAFDELKQTLPESYTIYHSEDWFQAMDQSPDDQDRGEIDFLISHQEHGILVLEVKGGGIEYDPHQDQWWTINDEEREKMHKSPAIQAQAGYYCLLERLKEHPKIEAEGKFTGVLGWGLFFPQMSYEDGLNLPDMTLPRERILFRDHRDNLQESIEDIYSFWDQRKQFTGSMSDSTWDTLNNTFFRRKFRILESMQSYVEQSEQQIYRLTEDQHHILNLFQRQDQVFLRGCAGSGKTLLSIEKARRLSEEGLDVLWLCYNENLADDMNERFPDTDFPKNHFHSFGVNYVQDVGLEIPFPNMVYDDPGEEEWQTFWHEEFPEVFEQAIKQSDRRFDAIIIDEAQDFADYWWLVLTELFRDRESPQYYVFYDPHQSLYRDLPDWLDKHDDDALSLDRNVRNTRQIGRTALELGHIDDRVEWQHKGRKTYLTMTDNTDEMVDELRKAIHQLFVEDELDPQDSVILHRHRRSASPIADVSSLGNFDLAEYPTNRSRSIPTCTIHSFKGLEAGVVFLLIPEGGTEDLQALYTGATRAKHLLWMFSSDETVPDQLPDDMVKLTTP